jgi:hypothetical protein
MKYFILEMKQYLWGRQLLILLVYTLWYSILGKPLLIEGCNRHYHWYNSESDRTGCDMVCQDLQNWQYCFIGYVIMCLMPHWSIIFSNMVSPMIHRISLSEIKRKMYKLLIILNTELRGLSGYDVHLPMQSGHINTISLWVWLLTLWYSSFL